MARRLREADHAPLLKFVRDVSSAIAVTPASPLEQLFVLECAIRGGNPATTVAASLRSAAADGAWQVDHEWEDDLPHAALLAQLLCVRCAAADDCSPTWVSRLVEVCAALLRRKGRFTATSNPWLMATLIRGLAICGQNIPTPMLTAIDAVISVADDPVALALLADASAQSGLSNRAAAAAERLFSSPIDSCTGAPVARWWLGARRRLAPAQSAGVPIALLALEDARLQSVTRAVGHDGPRVLGMALEAAGYEAATLVIQSESEVLEGRERKQRRAEGEVLFWRYIAVAVVSVFGLVNTPRILGWLVPHFGGHAVGPGIDAPVAALFAASALYCVATGVLTAAAVWGNRSVGHLRAYVGVIVALLAVAIAAFVYTR